LVALIVYDGFIIKFLIVVPLFANDVGWEDGV